MSDTTNRDHRNMLVMKASAGSGKTYNLALQYIKHLLFAPDEEGHMKPRRPSGDDRILNAHRLLLAITFTNKATDEMKERIVKEIYCLSRDDMHSDYLSGFVKESGLSESEIRSLARQALNELLFDYSNFNVSTIDSFFQSILRNFARELDRDFNYDIQLDESYAIRVAVHNFLLSLGREDKPTDMDQWVMDYQHHMLYGDPDKKRWKFFDDGGDLTGFAQQIKSEFFRARMGQIRDYLGHVDDHGVFRSDFKAIHAFKAYIKKVAGDCESGVTSVLNDLYAELRPVYDSLSGSKSLKKWFNKGPETPLSDTLSAVDRDMITDQFLKGKAPGDQVVDCLLALVTDYNKFRKSSDFLEHIYSNLGLLGMLAMIDIFLEEYRHETNSILIGDTNELIGTVLESGSEFIYERVGTTIAHFLIDEFQDTSTKQYENFRGLLLDSLAGDNFNMLIGDAKQSIYRFRNADVTVFRERVDQDFAGRIYQPATKPGEPTSTNYRSSRNIVQFNNLVFEGVKHEYRDNSTVADTYADVEQAMPANVDEKKVPGYVRLLLGQYDRLMNDDVIGEAVRVVHGDAQVAAEGDKSSQLDVLDILPGYLLKLHERYEWKQIGVLVNTNVIGNRVVESILEYNKHVPANRQIHIISGESLLLNNSPIIRRIIAMLRLIEVSQVEREEEADPAQPDGALRQRLNRKRESDQRLYAALNAFIREMSVSDHADPLVVGALLDKCLNEVNGAADPQAADDLATSGRQVVNDILPPADELTTLTSIVETIVASFKRNGGGEDVDAETAFLMAFQDAVMKFSQQRNGGSVREFLKFWDEKKDALAVSGADGGDAVNIMTIHKAKGLEFDCVVIPFATWDLTNNSREVTYWMPSEAFLDALKSLPINGQLCDDDLVPPLLNVSKAAALALNKLGLLTGEAKAFVDKQVADVLIDNLNKTYVAFTRPRNELHILSKDPDGSGKSKKSKASQPSTEPAKNLTELMSRLAPAVMNPVPGPEGTLVKWYEYGQLSSREEIQAKMESKVQEWEQVNVDSYPVMPMPDGLTVNVDHASGARIKAGIRLHSLMSRIHDRDDVDSVIALGLKHGVISDDPDDPCGIDNVNAHVRDAIMDTRSRVAAWFDPANRVYNERTITFASDSSKAEDGIENLRPDRIIRRPDGTILVIDYKTGRRNDKKNLSQLQEYIDQLSTVFPGTPIAGRLWYTTLDLILNENGHPLSNSLY